MNARIRLPATVSLPAAAKHIAVAAAVLVTTLWLLAMDDARSEDLADSAAGGTWSGASLDSAAGETWTEESLEEVFGSEEMVSIATGHRQPLRIAPAVASLITAEDIRRSGARDLAEILQLVPGFHVGRSFSQWDPAFAVRGFTSAFNQAVLLMVDGIPQTSLAFGDRRLAMGRIPMEAIERVEVIRGPGSALYGADAFSAVVNIITRQRAPLDSQLVLEGGSYDSLGAQLLTGGVSNALEVVAAAQYWRTDGHEPLIEFDQQSRLDGLLGTAASLAPGHANTHREELAALVGVHGPSTDLTLRASAWRDIGMGVGLASALDPFGHTDSTTLEATLQHRRSLGEDWRFEGSLNARTFNQRFDNLHFFPPGAFGLFPQGVTLDTEFEENFLRGQGTWSFAGLTNHDLSIGLGGEHGQLEGESFNSNFVVVEGLILPLALAPPGTPAGRDSLKVNRDLQFAYLQDEWTLHPDWLLTWGVRADHYSDFGTTVNPRAVLVWSVRQNLTAKLLYGRGFRAPTILERVGLNLPIIQANPELEPESVDTVELALDYRPRLDLRTRANLYYHETDRQIRLQNTGGPEFRPENVGRQRGHGLELEAWWDLDDTWTLHGFYSYQQNIDETTGEDAGYSPHHILFAQATAHTGPWLFNAQARYVGDRERVAEDSRSNPETYTLVDALTTYSVNEDLETTLEVRNVFDRQVEEAGLSTAFPGDMPLAGRSWSLSLRLKF